MQHLASALQSKDEVESILEQEEESLETARHHIHQAGLDAPLEELQNQHQILTRTIKVKRRTMKKNPIREHKQRMFDLIQRAERLRDHVADLMNQKGQSHA